MNETNDELNETIERNLRDAHQQVHFRPEWAERVLREIASEREQSSHVVPTSPTNLPSRGLFAYGTMQSFAAIAAALMLAIAFGTWFVSSSSRELSYEKKSPTTPVIAQNSPPEKFPVDPPFAELRQSVRAAPGFLAARLMDDPEFEIYVILPTRNTTETN